MTEGQKERIEAFKRVVDIRKEQNVSILSLCSQVGTDRNYYYKYLDAKLIPTYETISKFTKALGYNTKIVFEKIKE